MFIVKGDRIKMYVEKDYKYIRIKEYVIVECTLLMKKNNICTFTDKNCDSYPKCFSKNKRILKNEWEKTLNKLDNERLVFLRCEK